LAKSKGILPDPVATKMFGALRARAVGLSDVGCSRDRDCGLSSGFLLSVKRSGQIWLLDWPEGQGRGRNTAGGAGEAFAYFSCEMCVCVPSSFAPRGTCLRSLYSLLSTLHCVFWSKGVVFLASAMLPFCQLAGKSKAKFVYCQRSLLVNVVWVFRPARQLRMEDVDVAHCLWASVVYIP